MARTALPRLHAELPATRAEETALAPPPATRRALVCTLTLASGERRVVSGPLVIGSAAGTNLTLDDATVSRVHAELTPADDGLWLRDLGSRNGTYVNSMRIVEACVPHGATITVGRTLLQVNYQTVDAAEVAPAPTGFGSLVGSSRAMQRLYATLQRVVTSDAPVLLQGETGTGKEVVARALHEASRRRSRPLVVVDCGALPEALLEAELFGHVRGAFTGASATREGAFEAAAGGTIFLDEIGELPLSMQPKLLRALESRTVRRLGETNYRSVDVRVVAASHRDLAKMVALGSFREDLFFRLSVLPVRLPALRERLEDLPALLLHFWPEAALSPATLAILRMRAWPGNVRELRNFVDRARALGVEEAIALSDPLAAHSTAPVELQSAPAGDPPSSRAQDVEPPPATPPAYELPYHEFRDAWIEVGEKEYTRRLLERHGRRVSEAAQAAGLNRTYLHRLARRHGL